jgi:hypothetical protein
MKKKMKAHREKLEEKLDKWNDEMAWEYIV